MHRHRGHEVQPMCIQPPAVEEAGHPKKQYMQTKIMRTACSLIDGSKARTLLLKILLGSVWAGGLVLAGSGAASAEEVQAPESPAPSSSATEDLPEEGSATAPEVARPGHMIKPQVTPQAVGSPFQLGSFLVYPQLGMTRIYDNNVYSTSAPTKSDRAWLVAPALWVQSNWARHAVNVRAGWEGMRYDSLKTEDTNDHVFSAEGRYDITADSNFYGGFLSSKEHEDRESPSDRNGLTPTDYKQTRAYGGIFHQFGRVSIRAAATVQSLDYKDVNFISSSGSVQVINNDDRDRRQYTGGVRLGYEMAPGLEPYFQLAVDNRRYKDHVDDLGYTRDSNGSRYLAGVRWSIPQTVKLDAFAGYLRQHYEDARFDTVRTPTGGATLQWHAGSRTTISAYLDRTVEETTVTQTPSPGVTVVSSSYMNTYASAGVDHRLNDKWSMRLNSALSHVAYEEIARHDNYKSLGVGMTFRPDVNFIVDLDLWERQLASSIPSESFKRKMLFLRIVIPFSHRS